MIMAHRKRITGLKMKLGCSRVEVLENLFRGKKNEVSEWISGTEEGREKNQFSALASLFCSPDLCKSRGWTR